MPRRLTEPILTSRLRNRRFSLSSPGRRRAARRSPYRTARRREGVRPRRDSAHATGCPRRPARHARAESAAPRRSTRAPAQPSPHRWRVLIDPAGHPLLPEQPDTRAVRPAGAPPRAVSRRWNGRCGNTGLSRRAGAGRHVTRDPEPGGFETVSRSPRVWDAPSSGRSVGGTLRGDSGRLHRRPTMPSRSGLLCGTAPRQRVRSRNSPGCVPGPPAARNACASRVAACSSSSGVPAIAGDASSR